MPTVTEPRSGTSCESTRTPLESCVAGMWLAPRLPAFVLFEGLLARQSNLPRLVHLEHLDVDHVALLDDVGHLADTLVGELGDVYEAVRARKNLDEGSEIDHLADRAAIDLADLGLRGEAPDAVDRPLHRVAVARGDVHRTVVLNVDLDPGFLDDGTDHLAARADQVADPIRLDVDRDDARGVGGKLGARPGEGLAHDLQDVQARCARLLERLLHDRPRYAADLDVHLHGGDALVRPGHLEVHVSEVVLVAEDVGEHPN